jgi:hypothetical protein
VADNLVAAAAAFSATAAVAAGLAALRRGDLRLRLNGNSLGKRPFMFNLSETAGAWFRL